jgi:hypothetical protein
LAVDLGFSTWVGSYSRVEGAVIPRIASLLIESGGHKTIFPNLAVFGRLQQQMAATVIIIREVPGKENSDERDVFMVAGRFSVERFVWLAITDCLSFAGQPGFWNWGAPRSE